MFVPYPPRHLTTLGASVHHTPTLGQAGNGPTWGDAGAAGVNAGKAYLATDGDVLEMFDHLFDFMASASIALPPPWNAIAGVTSYLLGSGLETIRNFLERTALNAGKYCTVQAASGVAASMRSSWFTWCYDASKDKLVQAANEKTWLRLAIEAANLVIPDEDELNLNVSDRTASRVYTAAVKSGAKPLNAAVAAFYTAKDAGAKKSVLDHWARKAGAKTSWEMAAPSIAWKKRTEGERVSASQVNKKTIRPSGGDNSALMYGAGALLALFLLTRKR
jgi:hypothetical protein